MDTTFPQKKASGQNVDPIFHSARFDIYRVEFDRKGQQMKRDVVVHPGAVAIVPIVGDNQIILIKNQRFAVGKTLWEVPAGTLEPNEAPLETAKRELIEETGYRAEEVEPLTHFYTTPGFCNEMMYVYAAKKLSYVGQKLEATEDISVETVTWKEALRMIQEGIICDGKTIASLLYYHSFKR